MKKCQSCSFENADDMRFCVECGTPLPASPMVINLQGSGAHNQAGAEINPFDKSQETKFGGNQPNFTPNLPPVLPPKRRSYGKIFLVIGGIFALFLLLLTAGAAILIFNWEPTPTPKPTPIPTPTRTIEKPKPTATPTPTPKPSPSTTPLPPSEGDAGGKFEKMWVDYNVTEKGQLGMRIHVNFSTYNLKDVDSDLLIRFQHEDDSYLKTNSGTYQTDKGEVAVTQPLKPAFDDAVYKDLQLFMPYSEFALSRGKYNLKMDLDLTYRNGDFIQHLNTYEFQYEEK